MRPRPPRRPPSGATPDTEGFKLDSGSVSESPARRPAGVTDPLAATGASESRVRVSLGSQLAAGPQGPVSRRGYRHVTGIVPHKIPGPADACNIQAPTGTAGYNLWKTRHLQKGVQGGRRYTEGVLIQRPLAKSNQVRSMSLARVMFFGSHPPSSRKQGGDSRNDPLVGICTAYNGWHPLQLFLYEISCQQRPDQVRYLCPYVQGGSASTSCVGKDFHGCHRKGAGVLLGRICWAPSGGGPPGGTRVPGRKPRQGMAWCQDGCFLGGKPLAAQCTGQLRVAPVPRRKPGVVFCLICFVILGVRPLITFGCRMESSRVAYSVPPPLPRISSPPSTVVVTYGYPPSYRQCQCQIRKMLRGNVRCHRTSYPSFPYRYNAQVCW